jgi:hypothetical protein
MVKVKPLVLSNATVHKEIQALNSFRRDEQDVYDDCIEEEQQDGRGTL